MPSSGAGAGAIGGSVGNFSGDAGVRSMPMPGWSTSPNTGFVGATRQSSSSSCVNVWYGPQHTPCASSALRTSSSVRASNHGLSSAAMPSRAR